MRGPVTAMRVLKETEEACLAVCGKACTGSLVRPEMAACFRLSLECADVCRRCDEILERIRRSEEPDQALAPWSPFCAAICESCAAECERFNNELFQRCAELCRRSAVECRALLAQSAELNGVNQSE